MKPKTYTTFYIASLLDVYPTTIAKWIDDKKLNAFITPGGHRRVNTEDLLAFLEKYNMPIPKELLAYSHKRVLVVDDDESVRENIGRILKKRSDEYETYTAANGFQAGHCIYSCSPHLVILDIMLPGMNGFVICSIIRKMNKNIKVLAITGFNSEENKKKIFEAGADAYLPKPFESKEFMKNVDRLFSKKRRK